MTDNAIHLLQTYFAGLLGTGTGYEGGYWDGFDPSGTRDESRDHFTADDLLSASLLSADIHPTAILRILNSDADALARALKTLGPDRELASLTQSEARELEASSTIWRALRSIPHIGPTRASKLIARKRPHLVPIYDEVVGSAVYGGTSDGQWVRMHAALTADSGALHAHLTTLRVLAGLPEWISVLRVFDVIAWLDGSGNAAEILN
ncbi:DUF6308 family protein [Janibacter terrae]|uniref:DUF6308 family protein n=1 Tax=Janibacter terrae TaxID=103817 RepID=A0ABZ2FGH4_9MICO